MARIRTLKPEFHSSVQVMACSRDARLLFISLWNFCDDEGRLSANPLQIKARVFPGDSLAPDEIDVWLSELHAVGLIDIYEVDEKRWLAVTGWKNHQKIDRPTASNIPPPPTHRRRIEQKPAAARALADASKPSQREVVERSSNARRSLADNSSSGQRALAPKEGRDSREVNPSQDVESHRIGRAGLSSQVETKPDADGSGPGWDENDPFGHGEAA